MKCYTIDARLIAGMGAKPVKAVTGIETTEGRVVLGEAGRGRKLVELPAPAGSKLRQAVAAVAATFEEGDTAGPGGFVFRGLGRMLTQPVQAVSEALTDVADREPFVACVLIRNLSGFRGTWSLKSPAGTKVVAEGRCAQGIAGNMGGGPEYLLLLPGGTVTLVREGRLYGKPSRIEVVVDEGGVVLMDCAAIEAAASAAGQW